MTALNNDRQPHQDRGTQAAPAGDPQLLETTLYAGGSNVLPPLAGIVELIVLTGLIVGIGLMMPDVDLADIQPNPFWLPVLLLSLQYGTVSGVVAAATALLVMLMSGLPEPGVGENYFSYAMRVFAQPILWFGAAVVLGQFRMRQIQAKHGLTSMVLDLEAQRAALAGYARNLRRRCDMLERDRASSGEASGVAVLASLAQLAGTGDRADDLGLAFSRTMAAGFPGARASLLSIEPSGLVVIASTSGHEGTRVVAGPDHPLYRALSGEGRALCVLQPGHERTLAGLGLAVAPISNASGAVVGAVRLETADPTVLSADTLPALGVVAAALAATFPAISGDAVHDVDGLRRTSQPSPPSASGAASANRAHTSISWLSGRRRGGSKRDETAQNDGAATDSAPALKSKISS